jgi:hypothetical protein
MGAACQQLRVMACIPQLLGQGVEPQHSRYAPRTALERAEGPSGRKGRDRGSQLLLSHPLKS